MRNIFGTHKLAFGVGCLLPHIVGRCLLHLVIHQIQGRDFQPVGIKTRFIAGPFLRIEYLHNGRTVCGVHAHGTKIGVRVHGQVTAVVYEEIAYGRVYIRIYLDIVNATHCNVKGVVMAATNVVIAVVVFAQVDICLYPLHFDIGCVHGSNDNGGGAPGFEPCLAT